MTDIKIDKVRASRDGHQYHEAWMARCALGLLLPHDDLCAIAVEGLSEDLEEGVDAAAIEIADATFFFGVGASFEEATSISIAQFKYSIARAATDVRFADIKKTVKKFGKSETSYISKYGDEQTWRKFRYSIITNRPISPDLLKAIEACALGLTPETPAVFGQFNLLVDALELSTQQVRKFCSRLEIVGSKGALQEIESGNASIIVDWSASTDVLARARLGDLRELVRNKAGSAGIASNIIHKVDVLAALGLAEERELLPTPEAFPEIGEPIERVQLADFINKLSASSRWLIHAEGGIGKTVFTHSLRRRLSVFDEVVLFDCFGGGAYRSSIDGRHRPERGLMHIVNELACRGLCDPILPNSSDPTEVVRRSIKRFEQAIGAIRRTRSSGRLVIIMDAADNAAIEARNRGQHSFPKELMEGLNHVPIPDGLVIIATARTERRELAVGTAVCSEYQLEPFSIFEAENFIIARRPDATKAQIKALMRRSNGNPRVLANLIEPDRSLAGEAETNGHVELNELIKQRIDRATKLADEKGNRTDAIAAFLCALSELPPPVPIDEMAAAFGLHSPEVESLAADLSPLLERTRYGVIFRDEPTETLVRTLYGGKVTLLEDVIVRLTAAQDKSVYAARALPSLLFTLGQVDRLRELAFDMRLPMELVSDTAKRAIRLNRLKTALGAAAKFNDVNACVDLSLELSSIVLADERGMDYLLEHPDLVVALGDSESLRRLFELRTSWPGTRHARLTVAYTTDGDMGEAYGHAVRTQEWLSWARDQDDDSAMTKVVRPDVGDHAAIPYYLIVEGQFEKARKCLAQYKTRYSYKISARILSLCSVAQAFEKVILSNEMLSRLYDHDDASSGLIAAAISSFPKMDTEVSKRLLIRLSIVLEGLSAGGDQIAKFRDIDSFERVILRCALRASHLGLTNDGVKLCNIVHVRPYNIYAFGDAFGSSYVVPWLLAAVVGSLAQTRTITLSDCLPVELEELIRDVQLPAADEEQEKILLKEIAEIAPAQNGDSAPKKSRLSLNDKQRAPDYVRELVRPLVVLARCLASLLKANHLNEIDASIDELFLSWSQINLVFEKSSYVRTERKHFINESYASAIFEVLSALGHINERTAPLFAKGLSQCEFVNIRLRLELVRQLAGQSSAHLEAGKAAVEVVQCIEREDDVTHRSELFAQLARAIMPADRVEAASLFRRGLTELDSLGSGDFEFMNEILVFAASIRSGPLRSEIALRLAKICELNNYDSHKFPWPLAGNAFSRVWGLPYLAQISRWNDRDKVDLELTLPSALAFLIRDKHLSAADGLPLFGLVDVVEWWDWHWQDLFEALIEVGASITEFEFALDKYEENHPSEEFYRLDNIRKVIERNSAVITQVKPRLDLMEERNRHRRKIDRNTQRAASTREEVLISTSTLSDEVESVLATVPDIDPTTTSSIEEILAKLEMLEESFNTKKIVFDELKRRVEYRDRNQYIEAIVCARNMSLYEKNQILLDLKSSWISDSPSGLEILKLAGITLMKEHAQELLGGNWGFNWELNKVVELSGLPRPELAMALVEAATLRDLDVSATTWINLASILSTQADTETPSRALERLLNSAAARLADGVGDGPWCSGLDPGEQSADVTGGLVWYCLGSPDAAQRWRAAHVVRDLARLGRWNIISHLFERLRSSENAGAFQGRTVPFFILYAKLWFLFAVGRIAMDSPDQIIQFVAILEEIALNDTFPHVAIREAARRTILACVSAAPSDHMTALRDKMLALHKSKFAKPTRGRRLAVGSEWDRPSDIPKPDLPFHFEYDFGKYDLTDLATLFGIRRWEVDDRCVGWIRKWDKNATSMYDFAGRRNPSNGTNFRAGTSDGHHSFGTYLAWNAVAVVGGELLLTHPIMEEQSYEDPWSEWLCKYTITRVDGLWLADGTGKYPLAALHDLMRDADKTEVPTSDNNLLLSLVGIKADLSIEESLAVMGLWTSPDRVNVAITSALVPGQYSELAARALATSPEFHMWLPYHQYESEDDTFDMDNYKPLEAWTSTRSAYAKLDGGDSIGSISALKRPRPALNIRRRFRLSSGGPWFSSWTRPAKLPAFASDAWGVISGAGDSERRGDGNLLTIDRQFLGTLLRKLERSLVLLIKLQHYRDKDRFGGDSSSRGDFTHSWLVVTVDEHLRVEIHGLDENDRSLIAALPEQSRYEFRNRWKVLACERASVGKSSAEGGQLRQTNGRSIMAKKKKTRP